jgi:hypothetical protein
MMNEIVKARLTLAPYLDDREDRTPYALKRHAVQNALYGVDIDPGAVEIAKLRLWLSLIVDEEDIREIRPLPNLDYKIMQGDSLLEEFEGIRLFDEKLITDTSQNEITQRKQETLRKQTELQRELLSLEKAGRLTDALEQALQLKLRQQVDYLKSLSRQGVNLSENTGLFDADAKKKADELKALHIELFEASQKSKKDRIRKRIEEMEWELIESTLKEQHKASSLKKIAQYRKANVRPFFLWKLYFSEVFQEKGGFDAVIANPPYVRQEAIRHLKPHLAKAFGDFYCGTADLYTYFYKCGVDLLKPGGHLCFIAPNKFMRAAYGKNTRVFLTTQATPRVVIDFGELPVFEAGTDPAIVLIEKTKPFDRTFTAAIIKTAEEITRVEDVVNQRGFNLKATALSPDGWILEQPKVLALMEKLRAEGTPLGDYVQGRFYRGVLTGFNDAFVIDAATQEKLIAEDPASTDLIKPWLRGRDIRKWRSQWAGLYVIFTRRGTDIEKYPAIKRYLAQFKKNLEPKKSDGQKQGRKPGSYQWYEIQDNIAYYEEFEQAKIIYADIAKLMRASYDTTGAFCANTCYILPTEDLSIMGILHSTLFDWYARQNFQALGDPWKGGRLRFIAQYMEIFPIPSATDIQKAPIIERVQKILADPDSPAVPHLESEIDQLVYALYNLTPGEIALIEAITL